jgi:hypothetical protein
MQKEIEEKNNMFNYIRNNVRIDYASFEKKFPAVKRSLYKSILKKYKVESIDSETMIFTTGEFIIQFD